MRNDNTWQLVDPSNIGAAPSSYVDGVWSFDSDDDIDSWIRTTYNNMARHSRFSALVHVTHVSGRLPSATYHMDLIKIDTSMTIRATVGTAIYGRHYAGSNDSFTAWIRQTANGPSRDVDYTGWYRIGYISYPGSFTISISTIYANTQDTVATVEACTAHGVGQLFRIGMLPRGAFDQIRLVYNSSLGIFYVDFHYAVTVKNYVMTSIRPSNGSCGHSRFSETIVNLPDASYNDGTVVATISLT